MIRPWAWTGRMTGNSSNAQQIFLSIVDFIRQFLSLNDQISFFCFTHFLYLATLIPLPAVNVTVVPPLGTPLVTVAPLIFRVGVPVAVPVQLAACQVNPVLAPVSTIFTVFPNIPGDADNVISPDAADVGADVAFRAIFQAADDGTAVVKASVPALAVVVPE